MNTELEIVTPSAIEAMQRADVDVQITTAKRYPRMVSTVKQTMTSFATIDQETAESCFYKLPRGGKNIEGPSIRLAEIAASCYGNLRVGTRIIETCTTGDNPHVVVQSVAHDLEKNISVTIEKRRRIFPKKDRNTGGHKPVDEDDINLAANACSAIAFRDAVFKVVPMALVKPVFEAAKKVAIGDAKTLGDRRVKCLETFGKMGVAKERVLSMLGKKSVEDIDLEGLETMMGVYNSIKDGATTIDDAFPEPKAVETIPAVVPESPPAKEPDAPKQTPQQELADLVVTNGFTFSVLQKWGEDSGNIPDAGSISSFDDIDTKVANRLLKSKTGLLTQLKGTTP